MKYALTPITRRSSVEQVVERLQGVIEEQKLLPGSRLPGEFELTQVLQVSRPVLREALARMKGVGLVEVRRGLGTFVAAAGNVGKCANLLCSTMTLTPRELLTYAELRAAIEVQAVRQAAERATPEQVIELETLLKELVSQELPHEVVLEIDFRFHRKLIEISGNELMQNLMEVIYEFVMVQMIKTTPSPRANQLGRRLHREIVAAIRKGDPDAAERAMREHMQVVLTNLNALAIPVAPS